MMRKVSNRFKRFGLVFLSLVLMGGVFGIFSLPAAHAYTGNLLYVAGAGGTACGITFVGSIGSETNVDGDGITASIQDIGAGSFVTGVTDNLGETWVKGINQLNPGVNNEIWYVPSATAGTLTTVTVAFSASVTNCNIQIAQYDVGVIVFSQAAGTSDSGLSYAGGVCLDGTAATCNFVSGGLGLQQASPSLIVESVAANFGPAANHGELIACTPVMPPGTGPCLNPSSLIQIGGTSPSIEGGIAGAVTTAYQYKQPQLPISFVKPSGVIVLQGNPSPISGGAINLLAAMFKPSGVFYKYTAAVESIGCGGFNSTSTTLTQNSVYYVEGQADPYGISIANASMILDSVTTAPVTLQMAIYASQQANQSVPSGVNPFVLVGTAASLNIPVTSTRQTISFTPNVAVVGFHYYLIAVAQTDTGSGVVKARISTTPLLVYTQGAVASGSMPASIIAGQVPTTNHNPCIFGFNLNTAAQVTVVQGGSNTTASAVTETVTSLDSNAAVTGSVNFSILLILLVGPCLLFAGIFGALTHSGTAALGGGAVGLGMGAAIGNAAGFTPLWLVGVMVIFCIVLGILAMVSSRGG